MFEIIDNGRHKSALSGDMTPLSVDVENKCGKFVGHSGDIYDTSLEQCTCADFAIHEGTMACKHMIRLAMELGEIPNDGMITDHEKARIRYYTGILKVFTKTAPIMDAVHLVLILNKLLKPSGMTCTGNELSFAGIPDLLESGLFELTKNGKKIKVTKDSKKDMKSLQRAVESRLGSFVLAHIDDEALSATLQSLSDEYCYDF
jgi:hypothetical protein